METSTNGAGAAVEAAAAGREGIGERKRAAIDGVADLSPGPHSPLHPGKPAPAEQLT